MKKWLLVITAIFTLAFFAFPAAAETQNEYDETKEMVKDVLEVAAPFGNTMKTVDEVQNGDYTTGEKVVKVTTSILVDACKKILPPGTTGIINEKAQEMVDELMDQGIIGDPMVKCGHGAAEVEAECYLKAAEQMFNDVTDKVTEVVVIVKKTPDILAKTLEFAWSKFLNWF